MKQQVSISMARQAMEHVLAGSDADEEIIAKARHGCVVLGWLEKRQDLVKSIAALDKARPDLRAALDVFPGAEITDIIVKESV